MLFAAAARSSMTAGDAHGARTRLERAVELEPTNWEYSTHLAVACEAAGDPGRALDVWTALQRNSPDNVDVKQAIGKNLCNLRRYAGALDLLREVLVTRPNDVTTLLYVARCVEATGSPEDALAGWREVARRAPDHREAAQAGLRCRYRCGDRESVLHEVFGATDPEQMSREISALARVAEGEGQWSDARALFERANTLFPTVANTLNLARMTVAFGGVLSGSAAAYDDGAIAKVIKAVDHTWITGPTTLVLPDEADSSPNEGRLSHHALAGLNESLATALGVETTVDELQHLDSWFVHLNDAMRGRIATDPAGLIVNYAVRQLAGRLACDDRLVDLEIGILFGGSIITSHAAHRAAGNNVLVAAIDPLGGYYGTDTDPYSGEPVTAEVFTDNLERFGVPQDEIHLITEPSESVASRAFGSSSRLACLFIDGDHTYGGVKNDWDNFAPSVVPGGFAILDNYLDDAWPDVSTFVHRELVPSLGHMWSPAMVEGRTLVLRRST